MVAEITITAFAIKYVNYECALENVRIFCQSYHNDRPCSDDIKK